MAVETMGSLEVRRRGWMREGWDLGLFRARGRVGSGLPFTFGVTEP